MFGIDVSALSPCPYYNLTSTVVHRNFHDKNMAGVLDIFYSMVKLGKGKHLLERPILSYLAQSFNHPYVAGVTCCNTAI
jgi:hypothetical protein